MYSHSCENPNCAKLDYCSKRLYELFDKSVLPILLRNYDRYSTH